MPNKKLDCWTHADAIVNIKMISVTGCKSLYDLLHKRGRSLARGRLIDIEKLRNDIEESNLVPIRVITRQDLGRLSGQERCSGGGNMRYALKTSYYKLIEDRKTDQAVAEMRC